MPSTFSFKKFTQTTTHRVTQDTIDVVLEMHSRNLTNVGCVLQSRLLELKKILKIYVKV